MSAASGALLLLALPSLLRHGAYLRVLNGHIEQREHLAPGEQEDVILACGTILRYSVREELRILKAFSARKPAGITACYCGASSSGPDNQIALAICSHRFRPTQAGTVCCVWGRSTVGKHDRFHEPVLKEPPLVGVQGGLPHHM